MDIAKQIAVMHSLYGVHHIVRVTGIWVNRYTGYHASDLEIRIDFMSFLNYKCTGHQFVVHHLVHAFLGILLFCEYHAGACVTEERVLIILLVIDLVKSHPVFNLIFIPLHNSNCIFYKKIYEFTIFPSPILFYEMIRHFKM